MSTEKFGSTTTLCDLPPAVNHKAPARNNLRRDDTSLSTITKEIDDALEKGDGNKRMKLLQVRSNSLYKLSQEQIEDLILQEQNSGTVSREKAKEDNCNEPVSNLSETTAQEWELQIFDKNEQWTVPEDKSSEDSEEKVKSCETDDLKQENENPNKSTIYYDMTDVELLNSIEQAFGKESTTDKRAPSTTSSSSSSSRSSSSMSSSSVDSEARDL